MWWIPNLVTAVGQAMPVTTGVLEVEQSEENTGIAVEETIGDHCGLLRWRDAAVCRCLTGR